MSLKLYYDFLSQPSRALYIFLKKCQVAFESKIVNLGKFEHHQEDYERVNRFKKVPAIVHDGFNLSESVAIARYISREFKIEDHWYPKDSKAQARVDEYLEWQHLNTRLACGMYFQQKCLFPTMTGEPVNPKKVAECEDRMVDCLDQIETIWLKDNKRFLIGDKISIADIIAACEIEQPKIAGYEPREGRTTLTAWLDRVAKETSPYYDEAHVFLNKLAKRAKQQSSRL